MIRSIIKVNKQVLELYTTCVQKMSRKRDLYLRNKRYKDTSSYPFDVLFVLTVVALASCISFRFMLYGQLVTKPSIETDGYIDSANPISFENGENESYCTAVVRYTTFHGSMESNVVKIPQSTCDCALTLKGSSCPVKVSYAFYDVENAIVGSPVLDFHQHYKIFKATSLPIIYMTGLTVLFFVMQWAIIKLSNSFN